MKNSLTKARIVTFLILFLLIAPIMSFGQKQDSRSSLEISNQYLAEETMQIFHEGIVDEIEIIEYPTLSSCLQALESGQADIFGHRVNHSQFSLVETYSNITKQWAFDTSAYLLSMNTEFYPLNNKYLRQAIAYGIDKTEIVQTAMNDTADELDFLLPQGNEYSPEENHGGLHYSADVNEATRLLAQAGMLDVDDDGFVEAPNGSEIVFDIWYPYDILGLNQTAVILSSNLISMGLNTTATPLDYATLQEEIAGHNGSYCMALYEQKLPEYGFGWPSTTFHSDYIDEYGENIANIESIELDALADEYLDAITIESAKQIGADGLLTIRELSPVIPLFSNRWLSVYSEASFDGWIDDTRHGAFGIWNAISLTPKNDNENNLVVAVLPSFFEDFFTSPNPFFGNSTINQPWLNGFRFNPYLLVFDTPLASKPDGSAVPRHATSWEVDFLGTVPDLTLNQSRSTFYCDPNANWTDQEQMDAQDYRFTFEYYANESLTTYGNDIAGVKVSGDYVAGVNLDIHDPFSFRYLGAFPILPEHIWSGKDPSSWQPNILEVIGSGPYEYSSFNPGESLTLSRNLNYYPQIDTEAPTLRTLSMVPEEPIPAESVVFRAFVDDRSKIDNVTLSYIYEVGTINFTDYQLMILQPTGYEATLPARVTADRVIWEISAADTWGNSDIIATGSYSREQQETGIGIDMSTLIFLGGITGVIILIMGIVAFRKRR